MKKKLLALFMSLVMAGSFAACGGDTATTSDTPSGDGTSSTASEGESEGTANPQGTITVGINGTWDSLCPLAATTMTADMACNLFFECLVEADGSGGWDGRLAESFEVTDDNQTLVLHLREGVVWHDGEPFTADDVVFTVHMNTNPNLSTSRRLFLANLEGVDESGVALSENSAGVEKIDDYTVEFHYRKPMSIDAMLGDSQYFAILPEHILKDKDPATIMEDEFWQNPIGTGPFTFETQVVGESVTGKSFADYYLGAPKFETIIYRNIPTTNVLTSLMAGEIDIVGGGICTIDNQDLEAAQALDGYTVASQPSTSNTWLALNNDLFNTAKIRKAIAMLMDKETMIQAACLGNAMPIETYYVPLNKWYSEDIVEEYGYSFDPETAVQMLEEEGFDFDRTYSIAVSDAYIRQALATVMQNTWAEYGLTLEVKTFDTQTCISEMREGNVDFWINGGNGMNPNDIGQVHRTFVASNEDGTLSSYNLSRVRDPKMMNIIDKVLAAVTEDELREATREWEICDLTDFYHIQLISPYLNYAVSDRVQGVDIERMVSDTYNFSDWEVVE